MRQELTVEMDDGTRYEVEADGRDVRAWEALHERSWFGERFSYTRLTQLAHVACQRAGVLNGRFGSYDEFEAHCVGAEGRTTRPLVADPTQPGRTGVSSASSRSGSAPRPARSSGRVQK